MRFIQTMNMQNQIVKSGLIDQMQDNIFSLKKELVQRSRPQIQHSNLTFSYKKYEDYLKESVRASIMRQGCTDFVAQLFHYIADSNSMKNYIVAQELVNTHLPKLKDGSKFQ